jgi:hypothetical protein
MSARQDLKFLRSVNHVRKDLPRMFSVIQGLWRNFSLSEDVVESFGEGGRCEIEGGDYFNKIRDLGSKKLNDNNYCYLKLVYSFQEREMNEIKKNEEICC